MADSLANAAGVGVSIKIQDRDYVIKPLTVGDLAEFEGYVRSKRLRMFVSSAFDLPTAILAKTIMELINTPPSEAEVTREMGTMEGVAFLLWRTLRKTNTAMTLEQAGGLIDIQNMQEISSVIQNVSGVDEENPTAGAAPASGSGGTSSSAS